MTNLHYTVSKESITDLATEVTAYPKKSNSQWPFVTMPLFEVNAHHARKFSGVEALGICPLVKRDEREQWERYTAETSGWIEESRGLVLDNEDGFDVSEYQKAVIVPFVYQLDESSGTQIPIPVDPNRDVS